MMKDKYIMCKKIAPYVSKSKYGNFETTYLNRVDPASINGRNIGNFMNAFQLISDDSVTSGDWDLLTRKKLNGIPEDILGLTPIDISKRDILLSDEKRRLDNNEELVDYKLRSKHKIHQLKKKYKEDSINFGKILKPLQQQSSKFQIRKKFQFEGKKMFSMITMKRHKSTESLEKYY